MEHERSSAPLASHYQVPDLVLNEVKRERVLQATVAAGSGQPQACFGSGNAITYLRLQLCHIAELARNARQPQEEKLCCAGWPLNTRAQENTKVHPCNK
jgi:hypothetical protein